MALRRVSGLGLQPSIHSAARTTLSPGLVSPSVGACDTAKPDLLPRDGLPASAAAVPNVTWAAQRSSPPAPFYWGLPAPPAAWQGWQGHGHAHDTPAAFSAQLASDSAWQPSPDSRCHPGTEAPARDSRAMPCTSSAAAPMAASASMAATSATSSSHPRSGSMRLRAWMPAPPMHSSSAAAPGAWRAFASRLYGDGGQAAPQQGSAPGPASRGIAAEAAPQPAMYRIEVVTGDVRGAGSPVPADLRLIGASGCSDAVLVGNADTGFVRGSTDSLELQPATDIGDLRRVVVRQRHAGSCQVGAGWFLDRVLVTGPGGQEWVFPCGAWLGKSDAGDRVGESERNLIPADASQEAIAEYLAEPLEVSVSAVSVPLPEKIKAGKKAHNRRGFGYGGEDAYFYSWGPNDDVFSLGVADGVYMWATQGIDAGEFSRSLMQTAKRTVEAGGTADVLNVLKESADTAAKDGILGSSTCCIVLVDTLQGRLTSANVGDSGFLLIGTTVRNRRLHVKYRSPQQEHSFGFPYQLGHLDSADLPHDAMLTNIPVWPGDICILGTDGLFDNVSDDEILAEVQSLSASSRGGPAQVAHQLANIAFYNSVDKRKETPYSLGATEALNMVYNGGKSDDITVVVARLCVDPSGPSP